MSVFPAIRSVSSTPAVERLAWTLIHSLWEFALIAIVALLAAAAMRRASAAARYGLLVAAMMLATLAPIATWLLQPTFAADSAPASSAGAAGIAPSISTRTPVDAINTDRPNLNDPAFDSKRAAGPISRVTFPARPATAQAASLDVQPTHPSRLAQMRAVLHPWFGRMVAAWCLGVALCSLRPLFGLLTLGRLRRLATSPAADEVLAAADRMSRRLGLRRAVLVMHSGCARAPLVIGYLRPIILIPISLATGIPARQLQAILAHELAHVRRHDFLVNLLQTLVETLFFYHPGIWLLSRRIRIEREHCCDDLAMELLGSRVEYGRALLAIEEMRGQLGILALGAHGGSLVSRIRRIAAGTADRKSASLVDRWPAALLGLAVIGATCFIALHRSLAAEDASHAAAGTKLEQPAGPRQIAIAHSARAEEKSPADAKRAAVSANGEIVGRLIDAATAKPVEGATIACGALMNDSGKGGGADAVTDAQGRYRLAVPSPGIYNVWLEKYERDHTKTAAADDGIRVVAHQVSASQLRLVTGRKVAGKLVDADGKPMANMTVYCYSAAQPQSGGPGSATTDADGHFEFALPPGRAQLYAMEADAKHPDVPFAISRSAEAFVDVTAEGELAPLTMTLKSTQSKFGDPAWLQRSTKGTQIVRREGNKDVTGTVVDEAGKPIVGVQVFPEDGTPVLTNDAGAFRIETQKGTQFIMHAVAPGFHAWFGTPTSGDVLKIVLERKATPAPATDGAKAGAARDGDPQAADAAELAEALLKDRDYTELREDLSELQLSNAEIIATLGSKHPRYIAMKHRIEEMEQKLAQREEEIRSRLAEAKQARADAGANAVPARDTPADASTPSSRTFALRFKLASESADDLRQILLGRPGNEARISGDNQAITIIAPPDVIGRAQTFLAVTDWPDSITRQSNFNYPRESVTRTARSFFYACAIQDTQEVFDKMLSPGVLAELKGDTKSEEYENYMVGADPDPKWEKQLRGDWPGKKQAIERMVNEWNRYPLRRLTEEGGVAIGFGEKHFCSVSFQGAPKDFYEVMIEPDRVQHAAGKEAYFFGSLPPWWNDKPGGASPAHPDGERAGGNAKPHSEGVKPNTAPVPAVAPPDRK